jgi:hypothetical protein
VDVEAAGIISEASERVGALASQGGDILANLRQKRMMEAVVTAARC